MELVIAPEDAGLPVKTILRQRMGLSTNLLRRLKQVPDGILLDGVHVTVRAEVQAGQVLSVLREPDTGRENRVDAQEGLLDIVFEDADILVLNKPAGLPVHPSPGHEGSTLANYVMAHYQKQGQTLMFHPINRLDRGTSGLLCVAKTQMAAQRLSQQLQRREIKRTYHAVVSGGSFPARGTIDLPIGRRPGRGIAREVRADGERAVTHFRVLQRRGHALLLELQLETGRTHQIRVQFASRDLPLVGERKYSTLEDPCEIALWSWRLAFAHPTTGKPMEFTHEPPEIYPWTDC